jgi:hypothetical protein
MDETIVNKVANSGLVSLDLESFLPAEAIQPFDLKDFLFMGMILKEKDFRESLKNLDLSVYQDKHVAVFCSADAIIPVWAYMLVSSTLSPVAKTIYTGSVTEAEKHLVIEKIRNLNTTEYSGQRIVVKGCGDREIGPFAYAEITRQLLPQVKSIMYGEPCSTVPVYKSK